MIHLYIDLHDNVHVYNAINDNPVGTLYNTQNQFRVWSNIDQLNRVDLSQLPNPALEVSVQAPPSSPPGLLLLPHFLSLLYRSPLSFLHHSLLHYRFLLRHSLHPCRFLLRNFVFAFFSSPCAIEHLCLSLSPTPSPPSSPLPPSI